LIKFVQSHGHVEHPSGAEGVDRRERAGLCKAMGGERVARVRDRMWLVYLTLVMGLPRKEATRILRKCARWARKWPARHSGGGLAALPYIPRSGRPRAVEPRAPAGIMRDLLRGLATPNRARFAIADASGVAPRHSTAGRIMREHGLSPKVARLVHVNRASRLAGGAWWRRTQKRIRLPRRRGFAVVVQDESIFVHGVVAGVKYWSPVGVPVDVPYTGSHHIVDACGAIAEGGRQLFRTRERLDVLTFVWYLRELRRKFGRVAVILDRALRRPPILTSKSSWISNEPRLADNPPWAAYQ